MTSCVSPLLKRTLPTASGCASSLGSSGIDMLNNLAMPRARTALAESVTSSSFAPVR
jgi:hypothetical protein